MLIFAQDAWKKIKETMGASGDLPLYKLSIWLGRKPCTQTFTKKINHTWLSYKKSTQKHFTAKSNQHNQPLPSIINRWFPSWKRRLPLQKSGVSQPPKRDHNLQGLSFFSLREDTHHFSLSWVFHWGTGVTQPFPTIFPPTSRVANRSDLWSLPSWPSPYRVVAPRTTVAPPRGKPGKP